MPQFRDKFTLRIHTSTGYMPCNTIQKLHKRKQFLLYLRKLSKRKKMWFKNLNEDNVGCYGEEILFQ